MTSKEPLQRLSAIFNAVTDTALHVHERFESEGVSPLADFERHLLGGGRRFDDDVRATMLWTLMLFTRPRLACQKKFQDAVSARLANAEDALIVRHLMCSAPRAWSFRRSYQRGFAHVIAGPNARCEMSVDGCVTSWGAERNEDHLYAIGWMLAFEDHIYLISACELTLPQVYQIEQVRPFPLQLNEDDFWEENLLGIARELYPLIPLFAPAAPAAPAVTDYSPERRFERFGRIIAGALSSGTVRAAASLQVVVATKRPAEILAAVDTLIASYVTSSRDRPLISELRPRVLEAVGCDAEGNMPRAHRALLAADPAALLLLPESHPMFRETGPRDSIRTALLFGETHGFDDIAEAFRGYERERRWLAAFPCFDFSCEEHASKFGIPVEAVENVFDPRLFKSRLPIAPQGDVLRQLQNRHGFYQPDAAPPAFGMVIDAISGRSFQKNGNMASIAQWLLSCCDRWRYCLCEIEPDNATRTISRSNQKLLHKGLKSLSDMFKKK